MAPTIEEKSSNKCHGGLVKQFAHKSEVLQCDMVFSVFLPPQAEAGPVPVLFWLSGLTCTDQNFITKAGAQRAAAHHGIMLICPDTSPRGCGIAGEDDSWDFGSGAGFYVNATEAAWAANYNMYAYVTDELPAIVHANLPTDPSRVGIFGHSMGGHGALICALKNPGVYKSVSAFAPICNPSRCPWGRKAFTGYLGPDEDAWKAYDATELVAQYQGPPLPILIDQGREDGFYKDGQLLPEFFVKACAANQMPVVLRVQEGYDHSYYFIATFIDEHIAHHAAALAQ